jgi:peptide/nickel transport system substrate-binding protein
MVSWRSIGARRSSTARRSVLGMLACVIAVAAAIGASSASGSAHKSLGTFIVRNAQDFTSLDWAVDLGRATNMAFVSPGYDRLISFGPKGGANYVPYLATSWKTTAKSITFQLRRDAKCTDGHVLTAVDILNSIKRSIFVTKRSGSIAVNTTGGIGPGPYHLHASNKNATLTVSLDKPWANLLGNFAQFPITCPFGLDALNSDSHYLETHIAGSGPYTLVSAAHNDQVVWQIRPDWHWGPPGSNPANMPSTLIMKIVSDDTTAANLLLTGGLTMAAIFGPDITRLNASNLYHTKITNYAGLVISFNMAAGKLLATDEGVREAIMTAVDPKKFNDASVFGRATVTPSIIRPGAPCYDSKTEQLMPKPDIAAANAILDKDGWVLQSGKRVKNGQTLRLTLLTTPLLQSGPEYLQQTLTAIGIDVDFQNLAGSAYGAASLAGRYDVQPLRTVVSQPDAGAGQVFETGAPQPAGFNIGSTGINDPELQKLEAAAYQNPGKGGCKYWALVQEKILQKHYILPTFADNIDLYAHQGIVVPPYSPDSSAFPYYYIHPAQK